MQKKGVCCVVCPFFNAFWKKEKRKKEEARLSLYPIFPLSYSVLPLFGLGLATATLLRYYIAYSLSFSRSYIGLEGEREKHRYTYLI